MRQEEKNFIIYAKQGSRDITKNIAWAEEKNEEQRSVAVVELGTEGVLYVGEGKMFFRCVKRTQINKQIDRVPKDLLSLFSLYNASPANCATNIPKMAPMITLGSHLIRASPALIIVLDNKE
jgi:hypothetical protein